ncbi:DarT ssDNA thymidine ADP-ribosyltransferase family protein [Alkalihalobacillus sp. CinArs1]|uniref:DarT ssDNA thymidine ADP-ribosyltransferase family protein n=1 Tax=Alkalihalobacillus sp. CinArs1 TaxID=2995314 RepID=UPI0022DDEEAC|nr:DarT ssDNA thymidine ADP-ribosyltransferase family protein [Alkalihalobacillus sp. CinArs1]
MDGSLKRQEYQGRNITRLCHITRSQKAMHILSSEDGIKAVDFLDESLYDANDEIRLDGKKDFINCSIEYPNHWYWKRVKGKDPLFKDWVILLINPEILTLKTTKFCPVNAAKGRGAYINDGYVGFKELFDERVQTRFRSSQMLPCCPTDDQAEVLVYKNISRKDIIGVVVPNEDQGESEIVRWELLNIPKFDIFIAPDLFNGEWSTKVRRGIRPVEYKYRGGELLGKE